jgi:glutaredoxin
VELIQVPWSHNCVKVRVALEHKGLDYETRDLTFNRLPAKRASGQLLVPVLLDGGRTITDSTRSCSISRSSIRSRPCSPTSPRPGRSASCSRTGRMRLSWR